MTKYIANPLQPFPIEFEAPNRIEAWAFLQHWLDNQIALTTEGPEDDFDLSEAVAEATDYFQNDTIYEQLSKSELAELIQDHIDEKYAIRPSITAIILCMNECEG